MRLALGVQHREARRHIGLRGRRGPRRGGGGRVHREAPVALARRAGLGGNRLVHELGGEGLGEHVGGVGRQAGGRRHGEARGRRRCELGAHRAGMAREGSHRPAAGEQQQARKDQAWVVQEAAHRITEI